MRLGLDIGTNSIGWWLYATDEEQISEVVDGGVRIFSNGRKPDSGASLAVDRRAARSMRRRRDRYLRRRTSLMRKLAQAGLMPSNPAEAKELEALDPYELRAKGLDEPISLHQLGRALFHLNQRRGFKSNRKTDRGDNESGKIKDATARLDQEMMTAGARTYGEFLHIRRKAAVDPRRTPSIRTRLTTAHRGPNEDEEAGYDFYPDRRHLEGEFDKLWTSQASHHPEVLTSALHDALFETVFHQRPLKEPEVGYCLLTDEERSARAHPLTQRRVLYETVNSLRVTSDGNKRRPLTLEERNKIIHALDNKKPAKSLRTMTVSLTALARTINLNPDERFTLETANRDSIACDPVRASLSHPDRLGGIWSTLSFEQQWEIVQRLESVQSDDEFDALVAWLKETYGLDREHAEATANAPLPEGYSRLGETATRTILSALQSDVRTYSQAVEFCGLHHSDHRTGEILSSLPYYGAILQRHVIPGTGRKEDEDITRFGRITNPTVHIGLNQLRRLVNLIIKVYGKPDQIVVELARELKQSENQKVEIERLNRKNRSAAEERSRRLAELGQPDTGANRMLLRLYEELGPAIGPRCCPYTGKPISVSMLFDGSCDTDHILPYSLTLDDGFANRTLCLREANREKRNRTPWEAWGGTQRWDDIAANLKNLPDNKKWRFAPDAMQRFMGERDFLDRALVDTQYLSRIARTYLDALYDGADGKSHVWVVPGRLTEMLRRHWGLNSLLPDHNNGTSKSKNRTDHRHHAIDAAVVGATDRSLVKRISDAAGRDEEGASVAEDVARSIPEPWEGFRTDIGNQLALVIVSQRADHGRVDPLSRSEGRDSTSGRLHNDTAYGIVDDHAVVSRKPLNSLKPSDIELSTRGKSIRDRDLQKALSAATKGKQGKEFEQALRDFAAKEGPYQGIRRVRLIEALQATARVEVDGADGRPHKAYKGDSNHCFEIWRMPDLKLETLVPTTYEIHGNAASRPHPAAKRLLRLFKRDMVAIERDGKRVICYVQKFDRANGLYLVPHAESNADARNRDKNDSFRFIQVSGRNAVKANIRRIIVDEIGRIRDPGPSL